MTWLKTKWSVISAAFLVALAIFAAASAKAQKDNARKWQQKSVDIEEGGLQADLLSAEAANTKAKLHDNKATALHDKAVERINQAGKANEPIGDILDSWSKS